MKSKRRAPIHLKSALHSSAGSLSLEAALLLALVLIVASALPSLRSEIEQTVVIAGANIALMDAEALARGSGESEYLVPEKFPYPSGGSEGTQPSPVEEAHPLGKDSSHPLEAGDPASTKGAGSSLPDEPPAPLPDVPSNY